MKRIMSMIVIAERDIRAGDQALLTVYEDGQCFVEPAMSVPVDHTVEPTTRRRISLAERKVIAHEAADLDRLYAGIPVRASRTRELSSIPGGLCIDAPRGDRLVTPRSGHADASA